MQFIIINNRYGKGLRIHFGPLTCVLMIGLVAGLMGGLFAGGMYFAQAHSEDALTRLYGAAGLAWQREIREQRETTDDARHQANQQLNALAAEGWQVVFQVLEQKRFWLFWKREALIVTLGR